MDQPSVRDLSARVEELLEDLSVGAPPAVLTRVEELLRAVMALYGAGLTRTLETVGPDLLRTLADDEIVGSLLVLHDLHPDDVDVRVQRALDQVRPYLGSHAGGVSLSGVDADGIVHLRLEGSCDGCPSSAMTVKNAIEDAVLLAAPDVVAVEAEGMVSETVDGLLQIAPFTPHEDPAVPVAGWTHLDLDVPPQTVREVPVAGHRLLVANLAGTLVAYRDACPSCGSALGGGVLVAHVLTCPGCSTAFDLELAGRSAGDAHLVPVPLLPANAAWKVALPEPVAT